MTPQDIAWYVSLAFVIIVTGRFIRVAASSHRDAETQEQTAYIRFYGATVDPYRLRRFLLIALIGLGIFVVIATVPPPPYKAKTSPPEDAQEVDVVGAMWYWQLHPAVVEVGRPVLFKVTSADVNHGLGIYDRNLRLLTQTQAMPGYVNKLAYTFQEPGKYQIMCLEYCGLAHHGMIGTIEVVATDTEDRP